MSIEEYLAYNRTAYYRMMIEDECKPKTSASWDRIADTLVDSIFKVLYVSESKHKRIMRFG